MGFAQDDRASPRSLSFWREAKNLDATSRPGDEGLDQVALVGRASSRRRPHAMCGPPRRAASRPAPTAQSQTQTSAVRPASSEPISCAEAERVRRAARRRVQRLPRREALAGQRLHLVGVGHVAQHRQAGAAADVARQADGHAGRFGGAPVEQAAAEEQVRRRAVRDLRAAPRAARRGRRRRARCRARTRSSRAAGRRGRRRRGSCAPRGKSSRTQRTSARFSARWVCM